MTDYECKKVARYQAEYLAQILKSDDELLDTLFPPKLLGVEAAALYVGWPVQSLYKRVNEIPHSRQGKRLVFSERALYKWMMRKGISSDSAKEVDVDTKKRKVV